MTKQVIAAMGFMLFLAVVPASYGAPTAEQKAELAEVTELITQAGSLFKEGKFGECGEVIKQVQEKVEALSEVGDNVLLRQLETPHKQLTKAHALLELEGIELPELVPLGKIKPRPRPEKPSKPDPKPEPAPEANGLSFVKHIAPLIIAKCGKCHVEQAKGDFSAANYAALMKGAGMAGKVIFPGDASGSRFMEVIESGDMPRGGGSISKPEFEMLTKWINDGARFDGNDENGAIASLSTAPATPTTPTPEPVVMQATGKETVSFARDIAGVLASNCNGCHGTERPRENFSIATFATLLKGGDGGPAITPGKGAESLIVKKLRGTGGGQRMPAGGLPALDEKIIAKIEKWIDEGGAFDGPDAGSPLSQVASLAKAAGATHAELMADRMKGAETTWATAMPGVKHDSLETETLYAKGTIGENTLKDLVNKAEQLIPKVVTILNVPANQPFVKGRFTVLAVNQRYDFSEIGKVLLNTSNIPSGSTGLWRYNGVDAAGVVFLPKNETDYAAEAIIVEQATAAHLSALGKNTPKWFAEGVARVVISRVTPTDPRVQFWDAQMPGVFSSLASPSGFMDPKFDADLAAIASYSFGRHLMNDSKKFEKLLADLRKGGKFDDLFVAAYGANPAQVAEVWYRKGPGRAKPIRSTTSK